MGSSSHPNMPNTSMAFALKGEQHQPHPNTKTQHKHPKGRLVCTSCNIPDHTIETCYKIHGYPPGYKNRSKQRNKSSTATVNQVFWPVPPIWYIWHSWQFIFKHISELWQKSNGAIDGNVCPTFICIWQEEWPTRWCEKPLCFRYLSVDINTKCVTFIYMLDSWFRGIQTYLLQCRWFHFS